MAEKSDWWVVVAGEKVEAVIVFCPTRGYAKRIARAFFPELGHPSVVPWRTAFAWQRRAAQAVCQITPRMWTRMGVEPPPPPVVEWSGQLQRHFPRLSAVAQ